ncbi:mCG146849 [Mus musculus]|nr:mCG146849 [Mus musculus]
MLCGWLLTAWDSSSKAFDTLFWPLRALHLGTKLSVEEDLCMLNQSSPYRSDGILMADSLHFPVMREVKHFIVYPQGARSRGALFHPHLHTG